MARTAIGYIEAGADTWEVNLRTDTDLKVFTSGARDEILVDDSITQMFVMPAVEDRWGNLEALEGDPIWFLSEHDVAAIRAAATR